MQLFVFVLACYGVTNIVTQSRLLRGLRDTLQRRSALAGHWIRCPMCVGVPVGVLWTVAGLLPGPSLGLFVDAAVGGAVSSAACWILRVVLHRLGEDEL